MVDLLKKNMNLAKEYTDPSKPGAFAGFSGFYNSLKKRKNNVSKGRVLKFLQTHSYMVLVFHNLQLIS